MRRFLWSAGILPAVPPASSRQDAGGTAGWKPALLFVALLATTAAAEELGPLIVNTVESLSAPRRGCYHEHRFTAFNETAEPHVLRVEVIGVIVPTKSTLRSTRSVVVAPRSAVLVSVPQFVADGSATNEAVIYVDGNREGSLTLPSSGTRGYNAVADILIGRTVPQSVVTALDPMNGTMNLARPTLAPRTWSSNWLSYTGFSGAILTKRDWIELPRPVQEAMLRWVSAGGSIAFLGAPDPQMNERGRLGFGWLLVLPEETEVIPDPQALRATWIRPDIDMPHMWGPTHTPPRPMLAANSLPVKSLFGVLVLFAIVGGPLNMFVLAKKERRVWVFWTIPALAAIASIILVGSVVANEGWVRVQKSTSVTLLNEIRGEATTIGWTGIYATLPQDGNVRFDSGTEVRPLFMAGDQHTDWTDGQRFVSGWIGSRVATSFALRKVEPRRERLPIRRVGDHLVVVNGLGADIRHLWVATELGNTYSAANVPAGKEAVLTPATVNAASRHAAEIFTQPALWSGAYDRVASSPTDWLSAGTWVALVDRSPFLERALANPTSATSEGIVFGIMKGIDDAS